MTDTATSTHIRDLIFDPTNPRRHNPRNIGMVGESLQRFGPARSIVIDEDNVILAGNGVIEAAAQVGIEHYRVYDRTTGELGPAPPDGVPYILAVRISDLTAEQKQHYKVGDNRTAELAEWDDDILQAMVDAGQDLGPWFTDKELADRFGTNGTDYTLRLDTPVYTPTGERPEVSALMDTSRRDTLLHAIQAASLPDDVRAFLEAAASRHVVFDYQSIAEFYAHADAGVQRLMEDSALVIIDVNRAIEMGYVRLREDLSAMMEDADG